MKGAEDLPFIYNKCVNEQEWIKRNSSEWLARWRHVTIS